MATNPIVLLDPAAGALITAVCTAARDAHDDAIADAVAALFEGLAGQLFETVPGASPLTLTLTASAHDRLQRTVYTLARRPDVGRAATLMLLRMLTPPAEAAA